jgi:UDPglucose 6-dehydrogenase
VFRELHRAVLTQVPNPVIAVLGLAYKEGTHSTKNSAAVALVKALTPFRVRCFDPIVSADVVAFHPRVAAASSALDACMGATALAIMTPWQVFRALDPSAVARALAGRLVVDPYGAMDATACRAVGLRHRRLGAQLEA